MPKRLSRDDHHNRPFIPKLGKELDFAATEAFNLLRTNVAFTLPRTDRGRIIGITSAYPQEGKSYICANLAYSIAKSGKHVIVVDGDMRKPTVATRLKIEPGIGLSNMLIDETVFRVTDNVLTENFSVVTAGDIPPNPSELISSEAMNRLLQKLASMADYVLVDLPPVNTVSDALGVSAFLDGMLVVAKKGQTRRSDVVEAIRQLELAKTNILGFVFNARFQENTNSGKGRYYKSHYYKKGYGYYKKSYAAAAASAEDSTSEPKPEK